MRICTAKGMRNSRWGAALAPTSLALSSLAAGITITRKSSFREAPGSPVQAGVGDAPVSVAAGDFNHDGMPSP